VGGRARDPLSLSAIDVHQEDQAAMTSHGGCLCSLCAWLSGCAEPRMADPRHRRCPGARTVRTCRSEPFRRSSAGRCKLSVPEMWASLAIVVMWLSVLFDAIFGPDIVDSTAGGDNSSVPSADVVRCLPSSARGSSQGAALGMNGESDWRPLSVARLRSSEHYRSALSPMPQGRLM
jgi:hypothetical protein